MIPTEQQQPHILTHVMDNGLKICVGASSPLTPNRPGNGGFRILKYDSVEALEKECVGLAQGMEVKHALFNTGFAGAKVVCDASDYTGEISEIDKEALMRETSQLLRGLNGTMYTGCDMNTNLDDMKMLSDECDFVLAAIGNPDVCPNTCTSFGVLGAIDACFLGGAQGGVAGKVVVVNGCGNVGATVGAELAKNGATVYTIDIVPGRADIPGCINISPGTPGFATHPKWWAIKCDAQVPCSKSGLFTDALASEVDTDFIVGATNLPFATSEAYDVIARSGARYIPEGCTSAGAVIADSVEHFDEAAFKESDPLHLYDFVRDVVRTKTSALLAVDASKDGEATTPLEAVKDFLARTGGDVQEAGGAAKDVNGRRAESKSSAAETPIGAQFSAWLAAEAVAQKLAASSSAKKSVKVGGRGMSTQAAAVQEEGLKHTPYGAEGTGFYSEATKGCYDVIEHAKPMVLGAVERALASRKARGAAGQEPFYVADFGTADAGTSMPLMRSVVETVRASEGPATPIVVCYEDQTGNDWNSVFRRVHGVLPGADPSFMGLGDDNVFALAAGTTFYRPCFPAGTIDVGFSATAMHWLSVTPCALPDALHSACTSDPKASAAFESQAREDWRHIMALRTAELKPGGQLVMVNFAKDEQGQFLGEANRLGQSMHRSFADIWQGLVTPEEFANTNFPNQYRSLGATVEAFEGPLAVGNGSMGIVSATTEVVPCPFYDSYHGLGAGAKMQGEYEFVGDAAGHAKNFVPTTRTWSNSTFLAGVSKRPEQEQHALVDSLFAEYERRVALKPEDHAMDYVHAYVHVEKARK